MGLLDRLKDKLLGSDLDLDIPDFNQAPKLNLDFKVAKITLKHADHTAMFPILAPPQDIDITKTNNLTKQEEGHYSKEVYVRGWTLRGRGDRRIGGVEVSIIIQNFDNLFLEDNNFNCFESNTLKDRVLHYIHNVFGIQNQGAELGSLGNAFYHYPTSKNELNLTTFSGLNFIQFSAGEKGRPGNIGFATTLSSHHIMIVRFKKKAYSGVDYFSPETNLKDSCEKVVKDFMSNINIELSDSSLQEKNAVSKQAKI